MTNMAEEQVQGEEMKEMDDRARTREDDSQKET